MDEKVLATTLISVYSALDDLINGLDKMIKNKALDRTKFGYRNTFRQVNKIIEYMGYKKSLLRLKFALEDGLNGLKEEDLSILNLKYINKLTNKDIADSFDYSLRTTFRRVNDALKRFIIAMKLADNWKIINESLIENKWIIEMYNKNLSVRNNRYNSNGNETAFIDVDESKQNIVKYALDTYKNVHKITFVSC